MDRSNPKISFFQMCMILMLMNGLMNHVIVNPMLLDAAGRDAWISIIFTAVLFLPWCALLVVFMRKSGNHKLQPWLAQHTKPWISWMLVIPLCVQLYMIGGMTVVHTSTWTITNYLPATPKLALVIPLLLVCFVFAKSGIRSIAISAGFLLPVVIILGYFVAIANTPHKDFGQLKPMFENGLTPAINGMVYAGGGFVELIVILGLQHRLKSKVKVWQLLVLGAIMVYITIGPTIGAITEFGPSEAAKQTESPYEQWRLVRIGDYIEHVDFLSIYQWLSGACIRIGLVLYILADILPLGSSKKRIWFLVIVSFSYLVMAMFPVSEYRLYLWMYHIYIPIALVGAIVLSGLWVTISLFAKPTKEASHT